MARHLAPFQALIDQGLPAIMSAQFGLSGARPLRFARLAVEGHRPPDLLKGEMGFGGAVTTDDITMGGVVERFEVLDACVMAPQRGQRPDPVPGRERAGRRGFPRCWSTPWKRG